MVSTLGGLVFGYELGIISGALLQLKAEFGLSCVQQEVLVSALLAGALLASLLGGSPIDRWGRRTSMLLSNWLIIAGSLVGLIGSYLGLVVGRITVGFGMCISSMSCCIFVSEMVSPDRRGLLVTLYEAGITVGILAAYATNYLLSDTTRGWRFMFGIALVPTVAQLASICLLPANADGANVRTRRNLMSHVQSSVRNKTTVDGDGLDDKKHSVMYLFRRKDNMRSRTVIGLGLVIFQQFTGQPNILLYASTIFRSLGLHSDASAVLASVGLGLVKVLATLVSMVLSDRVGRRPLLIGGCASMAVGLLTVALLGGQSALSAATCKVKTNGTNTTSQPSLWLARGNQTVSTVTLGEHHSLIDESVVNEMAVGYSGKLVETANVSSVSPSTPGFQGTLVNWVIVVCIMAVVGAYSIGFGPSKCSSIEMYLIEMYLHPVYMCKS